MTTTGTENALPDVPLPAGACWADEWIDVGDVAGNPSRYFEAPHWVTSRNDNPADDIKVYVAGLQGLDGSIEPEIIAHRLRADEPITVAQARRLARTLIAAAEELDRMTQV